MMVTFVMKDLKFIGFYIANYIAKGYIYTIA